MRTMFSATGLRAQGAVMLAIGLITATAFAAGSGTTHRGSGAATPDKPYAGQQQRVVSAFSGAELKMLRDGLGMGFAKAAELNGYPGPLHILELAKPLALAPDQRQTVQAAFDEMNAAARALGPKLIAAEQAVDAVFKKGAADADALQRAVLHAAKVRAALRQVHLNAHIKVTPVLSAEQRRRYQTLRGYK